MNDSTSTTSSTSPSPTDSAVVVPPWACPPWCTGPARHYFEPRGEGLDCSRTHELVLITVDLPNLTDGRATWPVTVTLCQDEVVVAGGAGGVVLEPAFIAFGGGDEHLTSAQARRLSHALAQAADRLDSIAAAASAGTRR